MEADGAPFTPLPLSVLRCKEIQSYSYTDQRKVETDVEVTEDRTGDLSLRKPRTSHLSHDCSCSCPLQKRLGSLHASALWKYFALDFAMVCTGEHRKGQMPYASLLTTIDYLVCEGRETLM